MAQNGATAIVSRIYRVSSAAAKTTGISISKAKSELQSEFDPDKVLEIYTSLSKHYSSPVTSRYAIDLVIRRLVRYHRFSDVINLLESHKSHPYISKEPFLSTIIRSYGLARLFGHALNTYLEMDQFQTPRTSLSFNALLSASINSNLFNKVPQLFDEITHQYGVVPDKVSYGILVKSYCESGHTDKALEILGKNDVEVTPVTYTTVLDALYRKGNFDEADKLWSLMEEKGCVDVTAYNVRLKSLACGAPEKMKAVIDEMVDAGLVPDVISYNCLITCYCKLGMVKEAKEVYGGMQEKGCRPNAATIRTLVYYLCRNEDFEGGYEVFLRSVKVHKVPDFGTLKVLVEGLAKKRRMEEARELIRIVKAKFPANLLEAWARVEKNLNLASVDGVTVLDYKESTNEIGN